MGHMSANKCSAPVLSLVDGQQSGLQTGCQHRVPFSQALARERQRKIKGFTQKSCSAMMMAERFAGVGAMGLY